MVVYGIANCDSVKKAITWLKTNEIDFDFHDYKKAGITKKKLKEWCKYFGWENVLNKNGTTFKKLSKEDQHQISTESAAINFMMENTSSIKRPIIESDGKYLIRFSEAEYHEKLL